MDKYLQKVDRTSDSNKFRLYPKLKGVQKQSRLFDCKKVVKLDASKYDISLVKIHQLQQLLESADSSPKVLVESLSYLDCLKLHSADLTASQIGRSVKALRRHSNCDVNRLANNIVTKWRQVMLAEISR